MNAGVEPVEMLWEKLGATLWTNQWTMVAQTVERMRRPRASPVTSSRAVNCGSEGPVLRVAGHDDMLVNGLARAQDRLSWA
jgi:hypothetical protein